MSEILKMSELSVDFEETERSGHPYRVVLLNMYILHRIEADRRDNGYQIGVDFFTMRPIYWHPDASEDTRYDVYSNIGKLSRYSWESTPVSGIDPIVNMCKETSWFE